MYMYMYSRHFSKNSCYSSWVCRPYQTVIKFLFDMWEQCLSHHVVLPVSLYATCICTGLRCLLFFSGVRGSQERAVMKEERQILTWFESVTSWSFQCLELRVSLSFLWLVLIEAPSWKAGNRCLHGRHLSLHVLRKATCPSSGGHTCMYMYLFALTTLSSPCFSEFSFFSIKSQNLEFRFLEEQL